MESRNTFRGRDRKLEGYLALPDGKGEGLPGVVIQEIWGLDGYIEDVTTRRFAAEGCATLAPDLYTGGSGR